MRNWEKLDIPFVPSIAKPRRESTKPFFRHDKTNSLYKSACEKRRKWAFRLPCYMPAYQLLRLNKSKKRTRYSRKTRENSETEFPLPLIHVSAARETYF